MSRVLIDTNVALDLLARREPFYPHAAKIFSLGDTGRISLFVSSLTIVNTNYVLTKLNGANSAREIIRRFRVLVDVLSLSDKVIDLALNDLSFKDFEDAVQYYSAIESNVNIIVTRDQKGFVSSRISVMSPYEYLTSL